MHNELDKRPDKFWIWYGKDATDEEKKEWSSLKKLITLGAGDRAIGEVYTQIELNELQNQLGRVGYLQKRESSRLSMWTKSDNT